jgi:hypothetical protein
MTNERVEELKKAIQSRDEALAKVKAVEEDIQRLCYVITKEKIQEEKEQK